MAYVITPGECENFKNAFNNAGPTNGKLAGNQARLFFLKSGLPKETLAQIWALADIDGDGMLTLGEFCVAMKLVSLQLLTGTLPSSLPPAMAQSVPGLQTNANQSTPFAKSGSVAVLPPLEAKERAAYQQRFSFHDSAHSGFVTGIQAKQILSDKALPKTTLAQIWSLADTERRGKLSQWEFVVAMHLFHCAQRGLAMPTTLPAELVTAAQVQSLSKPMGSTLSPNYDLSHDIMGGQRLAGKASTFQSLDQRKMANQRIDVAANRLADLESQISKMQQRKLQLQNSLVEDYDTMEKARTSLAQQQAALVENQQTLSALEAERGALESVAVQTKAKCIRATEELSAIFMSTQGISSSSQRGAMSVDTKDSQTLARLQRTLAENLQEAESRQRQLQALRSQLDMLNNQLQTKRRAKLKAAIMSHASSSSSVGPARANDTLPLGTAQSLKAWPSTSPSTLTAQTNQDPFAPTTTATGADAFLPATEISSSVQARLNRRMNRQDAAKSMMISATTDWSAMGAALSSSNTTEQYGIASLGLLDLTEPSGQPKRPPLPMTNAFSSLPMPPASPSQSTSASSSSEDAQGSFKPTRPAPPPAMLLTDALQPVRPPPPNGAALTEQAATGRHANEKATVVPPPPSSREGPPPRRPSLLPENVIGSVPTRPPPPASEMPSEPTANVPLAKSQERDMDIQSPLPPPPKEPRRKDSVAECRQEYIALCSYAGEKDEDLTFMQGDIIIVEEKEDSGWWMGACGNRRGWLPSNYVEPVGTDAAHPPPTLPADVAMPPTSEGELCKALYSFAGMAAGDLTFEEGDQIHILTKTDDGWWQGKVGDRVGWFPVNYVETQPLADSHEPTPTETATQQATDAPASQSNEGTAPAPGQKVVAVHSHTADGEDQLSFQEGDELEVLETYEEWCRGSLHGHTGWFPANYVTALPGDEKVSSEWDRANQTDQESGVQLTGVGSARKVIAKVTEEFVANGEGQLSLKKGTLVQVVNMEDNDWWEVSVSIRGKGRETGWLPSSHLQQMGLPQTEAKPALSEANRQARALYQYQAANSEELSFPEQAVLDIVEGPVSGWYMAKYEGRAGWVPQTYVDLL